MRYTFKGTLCGLLCGECEEVLSDVTVRLYRHRPEVNVTALAVANPNDTLALLAADEIETKSSLLLAETKTGADGAFTFELGRAQGYDGEAFEIELYCGNVPHRVPGHKEPQPRQISITTLQPSWKATGEAEVLAIWRYCIPSRFWCYIRGLFDAWVICGRLTTCDGSSPVPGATVRAFDTDWLQDDALGSAVTDATGHFRIDYSSAAFKVTPFSPWLNLEWFGGPDVYFKATLGTDVILDEPPATGRRRGRENIGPCFCVELCTEKIVGCGVSCQPHWQKVWDFDIHPDAGQGGSQFSAEGYAGGPSSSFVFGDFNYRAGVLLRGNCPLINPADNSHKLQYRFVIGEYTWSVNPQDDPTRVPDVPPAALAPVTQIAATTLGYVFYTNALGFADSADVNITSADLDAGGWITPPILGRVVTVDMRNGTTAGVAITDANFLRTDELIVLNSAVITAAHPAKLPGGLPQVDAGRALANTEKEPIRRYKLQFEVRDATTLATLFTDTLSSIVLNNSSPILALDLEELRADKCSPLGGAPTAHVLYTVDHPHLNGFFLDISNNLQTVHGVPPMPSGNFLTGGNLLFHGGNSGPHNGSNTGGFPVDIQMDPICAYRLNLHWSTRHYPTGLGDDKPEILYCK